MGAIEDLRDLVSEVPAAQQEVTAEEFEAFYKAQHGGSTEVEIRTDLSLVRLSAGMYENGKPTNRIININRPWDIRVYFGLTGDLYKLICGKWCVSVNFESIGPGREFRLTHPEFYFDCHHQYWCVRIPGRGVLPTDCTTPYKVVVTVAAKSKCDEPVAILGFVGLPEVQFYDAH